MIKPSKALKKVVPPELHGDIIEMLKYLEDIELTPELRVERNKLIRSHTCQCCGELGCLEIV